MTPAVVVVGGSVAGLATALALALRGMPVRVLEQTPVPPDGPPEKAAELWRRPTVAQSGHSHVLTSLGVRVLRARAPQVLDAAAEAGARMLDLMRALPARADDGVRRPGDEELVALAVRRPVFELVLRQVLRSLPNVGISHGVTVVALRTTPSGSRVTGVVTGDGESIPAHAVVDATGRRAASRSWLTTAGLPPGPERTAPTRVRAFTRFYRLRSPGTLPGPLNRGNAAGGIWDHYAAVAHLADNDTYALTLGVPTADPETTGMRYPGPFTAVARLSPHLAPWVDPTVGEAISDVRPMTLPPNKLCCAPGAGPIAGLYPVGDAACVTDPLFGRGMSLALRHAFLLAELLEDEPAAEEQAGRAARIADDVYRSWYEHAVREDAARTALWRARVTGSPPPAAPETARPALPEVARAASTDGAVWRGLTRVLMGLETVEDVLDDEAFRRRVRTAPAPAGAVSPPPTREELVAAVRNGAYA
ncbi:NAD(P)/FAD-dependent oxidoreductase [Streptomyces sp. NPDC088746]|uniref:NAD(P)/FAD-dependent oxidoreductase n=1 Tax=Streptomyces sp. NPDC088746 TaxID=3365885 RepID=UPI00381AEBD6